MFVAALLLLGAGCGLPGPPQPPSLNLAEAVGDLSAARTGNAVALRWTVPTQNTDKTPVKKPLTSKICRKTDPTAACLPVGNLPVTAGQTAEYQDTLSPELQAGAPRPIAYRVALENVRGRSAGESNEAFAAAGSAPIALTNLAAQNTLRGIKLTWQAEPPQNAAAPSADEKRIDRITRSTLSTETGAPAKAKKSASTEHTLEVPVSPANAALDTTREWGDSYRYQVQEVAQVKLTVGGQARTLEMAGLPSPPVEVQAKQEFPPAAPQGLAVVAAWGTDGRPGMDLNWEPNTEPTLAGYQVYRITKYANRGLERRQMVSGDKLLTTPAFSDRDLQPGTAYRYSVVAVDTKGNVSPESAAVQETARTGPE